MRLRYSKKREPLHTAIDCVSMSTERFGVIHEAHQGGRGQQPVVGDTDCRGSVGSSTKATPHLPQQKRSGNRGTAVGPSHR